MQQKVYKLHFLWYNKIKTKHLWEANPLTIIGGITMMEKLEIELYKVDLAMKQDFNCEDFFRLFEYDGEGFI